MLEQHEDTKGDIRSRKWDRQYNAQENKEENKTTTIYIAQKYRLRNTNFTNN